MSDRMATKWIRQFNFGRTNVYDDAWSGQASVVNDVPCQNCGVEIGSVAIYHSFEEFRRANSYCHLYGAQDQRSIIAPCYNEFRGPRSDYVRLVALAATTLITQT
ncbi:hypothetical protein TNCV_2418331 [Trichonephila clavipes]|nr:hypothetical protein TNCV_2418331 [Trichonephila clavipes]